MKPRWRFERPVVNLDVFFEVFWTLEDSIVLRWTSLWLKIVICALITEFFIWTKLQFTSLVLKQTALKRIVTVLRLILHLHPDLNCTYRTYRDEWQSRFFFKWISHIQLIFYKPARNTSESILKKVSKELDWCGSVQIIVLKLH